MNFQISLDLVAVGVTVITITILGFLVYFNNHKSITNKSFFFFATCTVLYGVTNYVNYQIIEPSLVLFTARLAIFFAVLHAFSTFNFFFVFPKEKIVYPKWYIFLLVPVVIFTAVLTLTKFVFSGLIQSSVQGVVSKPEVGPGVMVFGAVVVSLILGGIFLLIKKYIKASGVEKKLYKTILSGTVITFSLLIIFNLLFVILLKNTNFVPYAPVFILPFIMFTSYSIFRYKMFNVKVVATQLVTFALWIFILIRTLISSSIKEQIINGTLFVTTVIVGILLIRSVQKEVEQRERLEKLTLELEDANEKLKGLDKLKTEFLSLASHQLRSPITAIKGYTSMLLDGSFGKIAKTQTEAISRVFQSSQNLAKVVEDLLDVAKIEQGGMKYQFQETDLEKICGEVFNEMSISAKNKGITLTYENTGAVPCMVSVDPTKIRQVVLNLLDNSVKYTTQGFSKLTLKKTATDAVIQITDSGIGMSKETKEKLFGKFNRGEGQKVNAGGSGLGLYLVKQIVEAHQGKIVADSEGENKGSIFTATIPLVQK
jgi:signal transduction histidine kinase